MEGLNPVKLDPIGVFHGPSRYPYEAPRQAALDQSGAEGCIELFPGQQFEQALDDLEGFERIWVIYQFHHNQGWKPKTMPPRGPRIKRGVFATRSPYRPNPIGLSCVRLERREGLKLFVSAFDLLDGTPILDLKPYVPYADAFPEARAGWLEGLTEPTLDVRFTETAEEQLEWLEERGVTQLRDFLHSQLETDTLDRKRKRISEIDSGNGIYVLAYRTWRARFEISGERVLVHGLFSGYRDEDLASDEDRYADKEVHRSFNLAWPCPPKT